MKCPICIRETPDRYCEKHHLTPKKKRKKDGKETINVCRDCADQLHQLFSNKELNEEYESLEKILASEKIKK